MLGYWAMKGLSKFLCLAPRPVCRAFAAFTGQLAWFVVPRWRKVMAVENIKSCLGLPEERAQELAQESMTRFGRMIVEVLRYPLITKENFRKLVHVEGEENLAKAYAEGKGIVMVSGHYGNWEMLGGTMALLGYNILSITRKQNNGDMDRFINEYREMVGQKIVYNHGENSMLAINRIVREGNIIGVLYDQDSAFDGEHLSFFGKPSVVPTGAALLARMHKAPIVPTFMHNNSDGTLHAIIYPAFYVERTKDKAADVHRIMQQLMVIMENEIVKDPAMWFWVHDRWKDGRATYEKIRKGEKL